MIPISDPENLDDKVDDLVKLAHVTDAHILHSLRLRFAEDKIYTYLGTLTWRTEPNLT